LKEYQGLLFENARILPIYFGIGAIYGNCTRRAARPVQ
jgi:hypothetical protein